MLFPLYVRDCQRRLEGPGRRARRCVMDWIVWSQSGVLERNIDALVIVKKKASELELDFNTNALNSIG